MITNKRNRTLQSVDPQVPDFNLSESRMRRRYAKGYTNVFILSGNVGFITNSSSVIYSFPKEIMEDEEVSKFIKDHELQYGFVGNEMWSRSHCTSLAVTKEQKIYINEGLKGDKEDPFYDNVHVNEDTDDIVLIYGDEYSSIVMTLAEIMRKAAEKMKISYGCRDYN